MKFPKKEFLEFCDHLWVDSKELGHVILGKVLNGAQRYYIDELAAGLEDDIHHFVFLKARQLGITTISAALDLFWHYKCHGTTGSFAAQDDVTRDAFRLMLTVYHDNLPAMYRVKRTGNNKYFVSFQNRSKIALMIGGSGKSGGKGGKGRGQAFSFLHATECSSWENEEALASLNASLAESNPYRLYIFESTARGMNIFKDMWDDAKDAISQKAVFIGWWRNEGYRKEKDSPEYRAYWDDVLTPVEQDWVRSVKMLYDYDMLPEQMAWWRWKIAESIHDADLMMQEFPPTEELAFILTGKNFFSLPRVQQIRDAIDLEPEPDWWRFTFGEDFQQTQLEKVGARMGHLAVWEEPEDDGWYCIGADPAYGSATWADRSVVQVYRCYADRFEQVAEFCTAEITTYKFAWVICVLAGYYKNSMVNVELNGPGEAVLGEIDNLRRQASSMGNTPYGKSLKDVVGKIRYFLYKKLDSPFGGSVFNWKTTSETKDRAMNAFRDIVERGHGVIHSKILTDEMKIIVREDNGFLGASGRGKDDCTIASAIASECYVRYFVSKQKQMGITWDKERAKRARVVEYGAPESAQQAAIRRSVGGFMDKVGIKYGEVANGTR